MTKLLIIPGFRRAVKDDNYQFIMNYAKNIGLDVYEVEMVWGYRTMADYTKDFLMQFNEK